MLLLLDDIGLPTAWMTARSMDMLLAQLHPLAQHAPALAALEDALQQCPPDPERPGRLSLGVFGERHAWLLSEIPRG